MLSWKVLEMSWNVSTASRTRRSGRLLIPYISAYSSDLPQITIIGRPRPIMGANHLFDSIFSV